MSGIFGVVGPPGTDIGDLGRRVGDALGHHPSHVAETLRVAPRISLGIHYGTHPHLRPPASMAHVGRLWVAAVGWFGDAAEETGPAANGVPGSASSAERALTLYREGGTERLTRERGEFTIAIVDEDAGHLSIVTDRFGLYPHFLAAASGWCAFAPEMRPLLEIPAIPRRVDPVAVAEYVRLQRFLGTRTWLEHVRDLTHASVHQVDLDTGGVTSRRYWDWSALAAGGQVRMAEAVEGSVSHLRQAVARRIAPPARPGVFLSGGLDSRLLVGALSGREVTTMTYGAPDCRDVLLAARIARRAGTRHHWSDLTSGQWILDNAALYLSLTEGMQPWHHMHGITLLEPARQRFDALLTGWEGGMLFRGVGLFEGVTGGRIAGLTERGASDAIFDDCCQRYTWPGLTDNEAHGLLRGDGGPPLYGLARESFFEAWGHTSHYPAERRAELFFMDHYLPRFTRGMVVTARAAVRVHCPYFDYDLVDFVYGLPDSVRMSPERTYRVLAAVSPGLTRVPLESSLLLPHPNPLLVGAHGFGQRVINWLGRRGIDLGAVPTRRLYADYENYLRGELRPWAERLLFDDRTLARGLYDRTALRALWDRHQGGRELHTIGKIAPLMTIEMALRYLVDDDAADRACGVDPGRSPGNA